MNDKALSGLRMKILLMHGQGGVTQWFGDVSSFFGGRDYPHPQPSSTHFSHLLDNLSLEMVHQQRSEELRSEPGLFSSVGATSANVLQ